MPCFKISPTQLCSSVEFVCPVQFLLISSKCFGVFFFSMAPFQWEIGDRSDISQRTMSQIFKYGRGNDNIDRFSHSRWFSKYNRGNTMHPQVAITSKIHILYLFRKYKINRFCLPLLRATVSLIYWQWSSSSRTFATSSTESELSKRKLFTTYGNLWALFFMRTSMAMHDLQCIGIINVYYVQFDLGLRQAHHVIRPQSTYLRL